MPTLEPSLLLDEPPRAVLLDERRHVGCALLSVAGLIWALIYSFEWSRSLLNASDPWLSPLLALTFGVSAWVAWRWPASFGAVKVVAIVSFSCYVVLSLHGELFVRQAEPTSYAVVTMLYLMPFTYGTAFIFLSLRAALALAAAVIVMAFAPIAWSLFTSLPTAMAWRPESTLLLITLGCMQLAYAALLGGVAAMRATHARVRAHAEAMSRAAETDALTGLPNRRALAAALSREVSKPRGTRLDDVFCVAILDIDHFKSVNDSLGHAAGDQALQAAASVLREDLRDADLVGRWGGEEFMLLTRQTSSDTAVEVCERLRQSFEVASLGDGLRVTVSLGVALMRPEDDADSIVRRADEALYQAKRQGRNRVVLAASTMVAAHNATSPVGAATPHERHRLPSDASASMVS